MLTPEKEKYGMRTIIGCRHLADVGPVSVIKLGNKDGLLGIE
jgi:hypothetical protein